MPHPRIPGSPNWRTRYALGIEAARHLEPEQSFVEIAAEIGTTPQVAYNETMLALGTLVWLLRRRFGVEVR